MKKLFFLFCTLFSILRADTEVDALEQTEIDTLKQHVCAVLPTLHGWCSQEKAIEFINLVLQEKPDTCVEIGVFGGSSLFPVASALKLLDHGIVIGIDPWDKLECIRDFDPVADALQLKWWASIDFNYIQHTFHNMIKNNHLGSFVKILKTSSEKAAYFIESIDILYIDGNHSETSSLMDVDLYLPKVRVGGYIWMNDTLWIGRQEAVELLLKTCDAVQLIDSGNCILFRKRAP